MTLWCSVIGLHLFREQHRGWQRCQVAVTSFGSWARSGVPSDRGCSATQNPLILTTQKFSDIEMVCLSRESFWGSLLEERRAEQDKKQWTVWISAAASVPGKDFELAHSSAFPHPESCMHSCFHPAVFPVPSSCMLDNATLFPMALFSLKFFSFSWTVWILELLEIVFQYCWTVQCHSWSGEGEDEEAEKLCRCSCTGRLLQLAKLQRNWLKQQEHWGYAESWEGSQIEMSARLQQGIERADLQSILDEAHRELYKLRKILLMLGQVSFHADVVWALALSLCWTSSMWLILHKFLILFVFMSIQMQGTSLEKFSLLLVLLLPWSKITFPTGF